MLPFQRTVCACNECVGCCKRQPGYLIPEDIQNIKNLVPDVENYLWASNGATVMAEGKIFQIPTITPKVTNGKCIFLDDSNRCKIHSVAPFGCAYFDTHMDSREGQEKSAYGLRLILQDKEYYNFRAKLDVATSYKPLAY